MAKIQVTTCDECGNRVEEGEGYEIRLYVYSIQSQEERPVGRPKRRTSLAATSKDLCESCAANAMGMEIPSIPEAVEA